MQAHHLCGNPECSKVIEKSRPHCDRHCFNRARILRHKATLTARICANILCGKTFYVSLASVQGVSRIYCSHPCSFSRIPLIERFLPQIARCEHGDCIFCCWPWTGCTNRQGYGVIYVSPDQKGKSRLVHRIAWEHFQRQAMPPDKYACHHCDFPRCINPEHIYPGTQAQNMHDAINRGRRSTETVNYARGERGGNAKLRESDIPMIFAWYEEGIGAHRIAKTLGVSKSTINAVLHGETWTHIQGIMPIPRRNPGERRVLKISQADIPHILRMHQSGKTYTAIATHFHVHRKTIAHIVKSKSVIHDDTQLSLYSSQCSDDL